jgi:hypothetical protein
VAASVLAKQDHVLEGSELKIQCYSAESEDVVPTVPETGSIDTLEVRNLPHNVSTDTLQLYFESRKSGGCEDGVKQITFVESGVARVQLTDTKGEYTYMYLWGVNFLIFVIDMAVTKFFMHES